MMRQPSCAQSTLFGGNFSSGWRFLNIVTVHTVPKKEDEYSDSREPVAGHRQKRYIRL